MPSTRLARPSSASTLRWWCGGSGSDQTSRLHPALVCVRGARPRDHPKVTLASLPMSADSDGYGTGLMVLALRQAGVASAQAQIARGLAWLERNQETAGAWRATSMNKQRDPASDAGQFMSDAATAYSVFALCAQ